MHGNSWMSWNVSKRKFEARKAEEAGQPCPLCPDSCKTRFQMRKLRLLAPIQCRKAPSTHTMNISASWNLKCVMKVDKKSDNVTTLYMAFFKMKDSWWFSYVTLPRRAPTPMSQPDGAHRLTTMWQNKKKIFFEQRIKCTSIPLYFAGHIRSKQFGAEPARPVMTPWSKLEGGTLAKTRGRPYRLGGQTSKANLAWKTIVWKSLLGGSTTDYLLQRPIFLPQTEFEFPTN